MTRLPIIAVSGSSGEISSQVREFAFSLGRAIAERGYHLLCGGRDGVMEAVCEGFTSVDGRRGVCIGILPGSTKDEANPYVEVALPTGVGYARNSMVALMGDAMIVVSGGSGTLSEAAFAWQYGKPIGALVPTGGVASEIAGRRLDPRRKDVVAPLHTIGEAMDFLEDVLG